MTRTTGTAGTPPTTPEPALVGVLTDGVRVADDLRSAEAFGRAVHADGRADLTGPLALALYDALHLRRSPRHPSAPNPRDRDFEHALIRVLPHREIVRATTLLRREDDRLLLDRGGVRVWSPAHRLTEEHRNRERGPVDVVVPSFDGAVSPGYFMMEGARPPRPGRPALRLYAHVADPGSAPAVLRDVVRVLEAAGAAHRTKVCADRDEYPRADALVVYLDAGGADALPALCAALEGHEGLAPVTSALARRLTDGVAIAWEPGDERPGGRGLSFGLHRCTALATALVDTAATRTDLGRRLEERLREASVDPHRPWRNTTSPDLPLAALTGS